MKRFHVLLGLSVLLFAAPASARELQLAIWCEFMPYRDVTRTLPTLGQYHCDLLLHVGTNDIGNPDLAALCREARNRGVTVSAWFLLPYDEHLYVGEKTVAATRRLAFRFADWAAAEQLGVSNVVFDCEPSPLLGRALFASARRGNLVRLARTLRAERDPAAFAESAAALNRLIDDLHARGIRVSGAANRVFLDFLWHGNTAAQDALNAPFSMIRWDAASFITYRYRASQVQYVAMINRYAFLARHFFGKRAGLDVGLLGDQREMPEHRERAELFGAGTYFLSYLDGLHSIYDLQEVVGVALGQGVTRINLYSLDGAVNSVAGLDLWLRAASESRPITGLDRWTPVASVRLGMTAWFLDALYRAAVGGVAPTAAADSP